MIKAEKYDIKFELTNVYITDDGKKFLDIDKAIKHQKSLKKQYFNFFK